MTGWTARRKATVFVAVVMVGVMISGAANAVNPFVDIAGDLHAANIDAIYAAGITTGCDATHYCPADTVKRNQMATFLARTAGLGKNFPVANGRGPTQAYCAIAANNPASFANAACRGSTTLADTSGDPGRWSSIAIGVDGLPIISAMENNITELRVTHCATLACTDNVVTTTINTGPEEVGDGSTSIAIGADGLPAITFLRFTSQDLGFVHCGNIACTAGNTVTTLDSTGVVGTNNALTMGADGFPFIAYSDSTNGDLKTIDCSDVLCSVTPTKTVVDDGGSSSVGTEVAVAIGANGNPVISYQKNDTYDLKVAACANPACTGAATITNLDPTNNTGFMTSIAIGIDGLPIISYFEFDNRDLWVAHCDAAACNTGATLTKLDSTGQVGAYTTIAIGTNGKPVISYDDVDAQDTKLAYCTTATCSAATFASIVTPVQDGVDPAMAIAPDGVPVISCAVYNGGLAYDLVVQRPPVR